MSTAERTAKPTPNLPPGFDFTDPDIHADRLPVEELAELRRTAPIWWNEQPIGVGEFTTAASGWCPSTRTSKRSRCAATSSPVCRTPPCPATKRARSKSSSRRQGRAAQHEASAARRAAQDRLSAVSLRERSSGWRGPQGPPSASSRWRPRRAPAPSSSRWPCELPLQAIAGLLGVPHKTA